MTDFLKQNDLPEMHQSLDLKLNRAYGASSPESLQKVYSTWAKDYDADLARMGYRFPSLASAVLARYCLNRQTPILDAGSGTGLVGTRLHDLGYRNLTALDFSEEMLQEARKRGIYLRIEWGGTWKCACPLMIKVSGQS